MVSGIQYTTRKRCVGSAQLSAFPKDEGAASIEGNLK